MLGSFLEGEGRLSGGLGDAVLEGVGRLSRVFRETVWRVWYGCLM